MPTQDYRHRGVNKVGEVDGGSDEDWGATTDSGITLSLSPETANQRDGQSKIMSEEDVIEVGMQLQFGLVEQALQRMGQRLGIPDSEFSGDIPGSSTAERLNFNDLLGSVQKTLFGTGPGPAGPRRIEAARCQLIDAGDVQLMHNEFSEHQVTWRVLSPSSGEPLFIEDSP